MDRLPITRTSLLALEDEERLASQGRDMLRQKREALARVVFDLARKILGGRERLERCVRDASRELTLATALEGSELLESLAAVARRDIAVEIVQEHVWGVATRHVEGSELGRTVESRGASPPWGFTSIEAARLHEEALEIVLAIISAGRLR